jgi:hypothetical protein
MIVIGALAGVIGLGALSGPIRADDRDHRREDRRHDERHWDHDRDRGYYAYGVAPPPVVYAPPPAVVASPGLNLMFNFR